MENQQKINDLRRVIQDSLSPLICNDYIFVDVPYYANIGDMLIWQATLDFLKQLPYRCLYSASKETYVKPSIGVDVVILLQGGGNFGDLWRDSQDLRKKVIRDFPNNKIVLLPQSIHYSTQRLVREDAQVFNEHKNLTMCFRDKNSWEFANKYFASSRNLLIPDMVFFLDMSAWVKYIKPIREGSILLLSRNDCERNTTQDCGTVPTNAEVRDWIAMENPAIGLRAFLKFRRMFMSKPSPLSNGLLNLIYRHYLRRYYIGKGVGFISGYQVIYTTRLHGGILAFMLNKPFCFFDNSYGKNRGVYDAWLKDVETIKFN